MKRFLKTFLQRFLIDCPPLIGQREIALVTNIAGTTRDVLELRTDLRGLPVTFSTRLGCATAMIRSNP